MVESERTKHTCLRLEISGADPIFVKGTWHQSRFDISVTDGSSSWVCNGKRKNPQISYCRLSFRILIFFLLVFWIEATEEEVADRAAQWDQPVSEYLELAEQYLGFQQPHSIYSFSDAIEGCKRVSSNVYALMISILLRNLPVSFRM